MSGPDNHIIVLFGATGDYITQVTANGPISLENADAADDPRTGC